MKLTWLTIKHHLLNGGRWLLGLAGIILLYVIAGRAGKFQRKADRAADKYRESESGGIQGGWRDSEKHQVKHQAAQKKARKAKDTARKVRDAVANNNDDLDHLLHEYNSKRLSDTKDAA